MTTPIRTWIIACATVLASSAAIGVPLTDEEVARVREGIMTNYRALQEEGVEITEQVLGELADEGIAGIEDFGDLSLDQIGSLASFLAYSARRGELVEHLSGIASQETGEGAVAMMYIATFIDADAEGGAAQLEDAFRRAAAHPAMPGALVDGSTLNLYQSMGRYGRADVAAAAFDDEPELMLRLLPDGLSSVGLRSSSFLLDAAGAMDAPASDRARTLLRERMLEIATAGMAGESANESGSRSSYTSSHGFLNGAFARGELVDHGLPALDILWSSDPEISSFGDLRGSVVVLDFWATWCGPCIASFPHMREMVEHYADYPVRLIGVTSLQGRHYGLERVRTDTSENPELEYELMAELMPQREMTWDVVFTEQSVYNQDFGIIGIPYVAVVDAEGIVRKIALHPTLNADELDEAIRDALVDAGHAAPGPMGHDEHSDATER